MRSRPAEERGGMAAHRRILWSLDMFFEDGDGVWLFRARGLGSWFHLEAVGGVGERVSAVDGLQYR